MDQELADAAAYVPRKTLHLHSPDGSTFLHQMAAILKVWWTHNGSGLMTINGRHGQFVTSLQTLMTSAEWWWDLLTWTVATAFYNSKTPPSPH